MPNSYPTVTFAHNIKQQVTPKLLRSYLRSHFQTKSYPEVTERLPALTFPTKPKSCQTLTCAHILKQKLTPKIPTSYVRSHSQTKSYPKVPNPYLCSHYQTKSYPKSYPTKQFQFLFKINRPNPSHLGYFLIGDHPCSLTNRNLQIGCNFYKRQGNFSSTSFLRKR